MRVVIDLQGAQTPASRARGIGRYATAFSKALIKNSSWECFLLLNGSFYKAAQEIRSEFANLIPKENIILWYPPENISALNKNHFSKECGEIIYECVLRSLHPDMVIISSLFEGLNDNFAASVKKTKTNIFVAAILYDLIPWINKDAYLKDNITYNWYKEKLDYLKNTDLMFSISESSRQEAILYADVEPHKIINISSAVSNIFIKKDISNERQSFLKQKYSISRPFIMYTGGMDFRKNIDGLIKAFAMLPNGLRANYHLIIVCSMQEMEKKSVKDKIANANLSNEDVIITGFVPEEDLIDLYNLCELFVFPSKHEGFGLPVLEAMSCGKPVICSNVSSLPEVIGVSEATFDPFDAKDISNLIQKTLTDKQFMEKLRSNSMERYKLFSWDITAQVAIEAVEKLIASKPTHNIAISKKPKLAYISPLPPQKSGIAYYSAELILELVNHYDIDIVVDQKYVNSSVINKNYKVIDHVSFKSSHRNYDRVMYHFGNSEFHSYMLDLIDIIPGVVVLHDFFLSGLILHTDTHGVRPKLFTKELLNSHGYPSLKDRFNAKDMVDIVLKYPCNMGVLQKAVGVIVHSEFSINLANKWLPKVDNWKVIPHLRKIKENNKSDKSNNDFIVCSFGLLSQTKLNDRLISCWSKSKLASDKNCHLVFVGENEQTTYGKKLKQMINQCECKERIKITGWADDETYEYYLSIADVAVQLRTSSRGETSGTVMDCLGNMVATIVNSNGSMAYLPDDTVVKLLDDFKDEELITALETLWLDGSLRAKLAQSGLEQIKNYHSPAACAKSYYNAIEEFYHNKNIDYDDVISLIPSCNLKKSAKEQLISVADSIAKTFPYNLRAKQILIDVTNISKYFNKDTDIANNCKQILSDGLALSVKYRKFEPVYQKDKTFKYARNFSFKSLGCPSLLEDEPVEYVHGDIYLYFKFNENKELHAKLEAAGVDVIQITDTAKWHNLKSGFV